VSTLRAVIDERERSGVAVLVGGACRSAIWPAQGDRKHGLTKLAAGVSLEPMSALWSTSAGSVKHYALRPFLIRVDRDVDLLDVASDAGVGASETGNHQLTANSIASRKLPTHPKY